MIVLSTVYRMQVHTCIEQKVIVMESYIDQLSLVIAFLVISRLIVKAQTIILRVTQIERAIDRRCY